MRPSWLVWKSFCTFKMERYRQFWQTKHRNKTYYVKWNKSSPKQLAKSNNKKLPLDVNYCERYSYRVVFCVLCSNRMRKKSNEAVIQRMHASDTAVIAFRIICNSANRVNAKNYWRSVVKTTHRYFNFH